MPRGGTRAGAGKPRSEFHLAKEDYQILRVLRDYYRTQWHDETVTPDKVLSHLIQQAYRKEVQGAAG